MWARLEQGITCPTGATATFCQAAGPFDARSTETLLGWTAGAGVEYAINRNWSLKGEVLFGKFDDKDYTGNAGNFGTQTTPVELELNYTAKIGVNYRF